MIRTRTALTASAVAVVVAAGGTATALAVDRPAAPSETFATVVDPTTGAAVTPRAATAPRTALTGDDGLTHAQATEARRAALRAVAGRVASIERDNGRSTTYDVKVLTKAGRAREVHLDSALKVVRTTKDGRDGLTYATLGRASGAATEQVRGIVTGVDVEDEGRARYEVEVLTSRSTERVVRLSSSYGVVTGTTDDGDDD